MATSSTSEWFRARLPADEVEQARIGGSLLFALAAGLLMGGLAGGALAWATRSLVWTVVAGAAAGLVVSPLAVVGADLGVLLEVGFDGFHHHLDAETRAGRKARWAGTIVVGALAGATALFVLPSALVGAVLSPLPGELGAAWARLVSHVGPWWQARRHRPPRWPLGPYRTLAIVPAALPSPTDQPSSTTRGERVFEGVGTVLVWLTVATSMVAEGYFWWWALRG